MAKPKTRRRKLFTKRELKQIRDGKLRLVYGGNVLLTPKNAWLGKGV